jgi:hypothetical protein
MQSVSSTLAAAILATERQPLVRLRVDWNRNGNYADTYQATVGGTFVSTRKALSLNPDQTTTQINADLDHLAALGIPVLWLVLAVEWAFPSDSTGDSAVLAKYDAAVNGAAARGMQVAIQAHGCPTWINAAGTWHGPNTSTERSNWVACLHTFLARYDATKIGWVEIWNEPNLTTFWTQGANPGEYARLLQAAYVDVKATWPGVKVVGHNMSRNDIGWYEAVYTQLDTIFGSSTAAANKYYFDVGGVHPYCGNSTSGYDPADNSHADVPGTGGGALDPDYLGYRRVRDAIIAKEGAAKPLAFGEFGYPVTGSGWFLVTEANRAAYLPTAVTLARDDNYVEYINCYYHRPSEAATDYGTSFNIHPLAGATSSETAFAAAAAAANTGTTTLTLPLDDLSADVVGVELSRELATDLPAQARLFAGSAAAEAVVRLCRRDPGLDPAKHTAWHYSPLNTASPLYGVKRKGAPAILEVGFVGDAGPEYVTVLTGRVRSLEVERGGQIATMRLLDGGADMRNQVQLPMIVADGMLSGGVPFRPGLNTTFLADWVARKCGYYASPKPRSLCKLSVTSHGSGWPEVGTLNAYKGALGGKLFFTPSTDLPFAAQWVQAVDTNGSSTEELSYTLNGTCSVNNGGNILWEGWRAFDGWSVDAPLFILYRAGSANPYVSAYWEAASGRLVVTFNRGPGDGSTNRTTGAGGPVVSQNIWDYYAIQIAFTSTGADVTFRFNGTTSGPVHVATASVTGASALDSFGLARGKISSFVDGYYNGRSEADQVTTESSTSTWNNAFVPTAEIHTSTAIDNKLVATPDATERGWPLLEAIAEGEFATVGFTPTGVLHYWPRTRWTTAPYTTSQRTLSPTTALKDLQTAEAIDQLYNRVVIRARVPVVAASAQVWELGEKVKLGNGETKTFLAEPGAVTNCDTSFTYGWAPGGSHYLAGTTDDGSGAETSNLVVTISVISASLVSVAVFNPNAFAVWLVADANAAGLPADETGNPSLWLHAQAVDFEQGPQRVEAVDFTSISDYDFEQILELEDSDFRQSTTDLATLAADLVGDLGDPPPAIQDVPVVGDPRLELGDRVTITDPDGLAFTADFHCSKIALSLDSGGLAMTLSLRKA